MSNSKPSDTQPIRRTPKGDTRPVPVSPIKPSKPTKRSAQIAGFPVRVILPVFLAMLLLVFLSSLLGWSQGRFERNQIDQAQLGEYLLEQYVLANGDYNEGRFDLARQRYEYIFGKDQDYLDVAVRWLDVMVIINGTATSTTVSLDITPSATFDPRPAQELFAFAQSSMAAQDWDQAIQILSSLRTEDPSYSFVEVDGMLYLSLRNRGIRKISVEGNFEAGLYDFALAEGFGPIDATATNLRELARLYLIGNSFWFAYPDVAAYYYGQVSAVAPNMRDSNGISAFYRYWASLVHYADQLAGDEDWCAATDQYSIALNARHDQNIAPTAQFVTELCYLLTPTATATATGTSTSTSTATLGPSLTPTATGTAGATATPSPTQVGADTPTPTPPGTNTPQPTPPNTNTPEPTLPGTATPTPTTELAAPTPTPTSTPTSTGAP